MTTPSKWVCSVCGYVHEGPTPPDECPVCGVGADMFEPKEADDEAGDVTPAPVAEATRRWRCTVCDYIHAGEAPPAECPVCGAPASDFVATDKVPEVAGDGARARTVSDLMVETMVNWGISHVFGMVGHSNLGLADAIRRRSDSGDLSFIGIRHEGAAAFAASAFAKLTGRPAACLSIAGPGATNLLTGLWDAKVDRAPVLALTGQVDTQVLGPGAFQELDLAGVFSAVAAWSQTVLESSNHAELVSLAIKHAILERDVAHLICPDQVQGAASSYAGPAPGPAGRLPAREIAPPQPALARALELIGEARRPAIIVGHGARFHIDGVIALAELLNCPIITTFKGKGIVSDDHPLACGVLGRSGTPVAGHFMASADLLLVFGASFSKHTGISSSIPTVQVDYDPMILGKFHPVTVPVLGEIGVTARLLTDSLRSPGRSWPDQRAEISDRWSDWRATKKARRSEDRGHGVNAAAIFAALSRQLPDRAVIAVDVGNNTYSFGRYFECKHQSVLMSGYLGSIGFGYPAAIGAWAAAPERAIVAVTGDGGFAQYMGELLTAVKYNMNITHILLNNHELGKITKEQRAAEMPVWSTSLHNPNFAEFAELCGARGLRVTSAEQLDEALAAALAHEGPALVEIMSDPELT